MSPKRGLGKGLDALIPMGPPPTGVVQVPVDSIRRNPRQPRSRMDLAELDELAASIHEHGIIQPLIVSQDSVPDRYTLIAGERRLEAAKRAGLAAVPALVREASEQQLLEVALIENVQRTDLQPLEAAEAFRQLHEEFGLSHEAIAERVGKKRTTVTNILRLLKLPAKVREALADGRLSEGHARALLTLPTPQAQTAAAQTIVERGLNVRQAEELVRSLTGKRTPRSGATARSGEVVELEARFREALSTRVSLTHGRKGGTIVIHYYSDEELNAIADKILGEER